MSGEEALALPTPTHSAEVNDESNIDCDQGSSGKEARGQPSDGLPTISVYINWSMVKLVLLLIFLKVTKPIVDIKWGLTVYRYMYICRHR